MITSILKQEALQQRLPNLDRYELLASICKSSFYQFLKTFWGMVVAEKPVYNWHMEYLCDELQMLAEDVFAGFPKQYDLVINIPPGTSKSTICSVMFPAWCWARMPTARFICGSFAYTLSTRLSRLCRDVIKSDLYHKLFPKIEIRSDQDTKEYFANTLGGDRFSVGVGGSVMGMHGHFILIDDPLDPQQALSGAELITANHWMNEVVSRRKVSLDLTPTVTIMQRLHQNDPAGDRLDKADKMPVKHICIPAELEDGPKPEELRQYYLGGLMDPVRLNRVVLEEAMTQLGEYGYAGQYRQNPVPRGGALFHVEMFKLDRPPALDRFKRFIRYWDKAGTQGGGAYTCGVKMGLDMDNRYWVLDVQRYQLDSLRRETLIDQTVEADGKFVPVRLEQEGGSGGKESAESTVRRLASKYRILATVHKTGAREGDKEKRAYPFSVQVNAGNVWLAEAHWNKAYVDELRYFPKSKYKDQVDASSGAFNAIETRLRVGALS